MWEAGVELGQAGYIPVIEGGMAMMSWNLAYHSGRLKGCADLLSKKCTYEEIRGRLEDGPSKVNPFSRGVYNAYAEFGHSVYESVCGEDVEGVGGWYSDQSDIIVIPKRFDAAELHIARFMYGDDVHEHELIHRIHMKNGEITENTGAPEEYFAQHDFSPEHEWNVEQREDLSEKYRVSESTTEAVVLEYPDFDQLRNNVFEKEMKESAYRDGLDEEDIDQYLEGDDMTETSSDTNISPSQEDTRRNQRSDTVFTRWFGELVANYLTAGRFAPVLNRDSREKLEQYDFDAEEVKTADTALKKIDKDANFDPRTLIDMCAEREDYDEMIDYAEQLEPVKWHEAARLNGGLIKRF